MNYGGDCRTAPATLGLLIGFKGQVKSFPLLYSSPARRNEGVCSIRFIQGYPWLTLGHDSDWYCPEGRWELRHLACLRAAALVWTIHKGLSVGQCH